MEDKIRVLGTCLDYLNMETALERVQEFLRRDRLDTIGIITMSSLLEAQEDEQRKEYLEHLSMSIFGEVEVLEAAGVQSGQIYEETAEDVVPARMFWYLIRQNARFFLLGDSEEEVDTLKRYLRETYPDLQIAGTAVWQENEGKSADWLINEINSVSPELIISGLKSLGQEKFLMEHQQEITGKIWLSLGEHPGIQNEAGIVVSRWAHFLQKSTFRRLAARFKEEDETGILE